MLHFRNLVNKIKQQHNNNRNPNNNKSHKMHLQSAKTLAQSYGWMQVFLLLTLFVIGNQSAWQENIRPKLYVELGK